MLEMSDGAILKEEDRGSLKNMDVSKAAGTDGIRPAILKLLVACRGPVDINSHTGAYRRRQR